MKQLTIAVAIASGVLGGCASSGPIPIGRDSYMITKQSAGGIFVSGASVKIDLLKEANAYCLSMSKEMQILNTREADAIPAVRMPSAEIQFSCLASNDPGLTRPHLQRAPDQIIEIRK